MVTSETFQGELTRIEREIERLQEIRYRADADFRLVREEAGLLQALAVYLLRRDLLRRIQELRLQRRMILNCYAEASKHEERMAQTVRPR